jgi:choice-of-anchor C domain-containing protein
VGGNLGYKFKFKEGTKMGYKIGVKKYIVAAAASVAAAGAFAAPALAASLSNGSFENGTDPVSFMQVNSPDSTTITNWTVSSGNIDYIGTYWQASDGSRSLDLDGSSSGSIQQTFTTVAGHTYYVTFDMAGNPDGGPNPKTMTVDTGGTPTTYSFDTTGATKTDMNWTPMTYFFTASGPSTTLTFTSTTPGSFGPALDNVSVTDVLTNKSQCMNGGWQAYTDPSFKNQGQCIAYLNGNNNVVKLNIRNHVNITNNNTQNATSGNAKVKNNSTGGSATSGGASNTNSTTNTVNVTNNPSF